MKSRKKEPSEVIEAFIQELSDLAITAKEALKQIESAPEANKGLFSIFAEQMIAIRGTAQQLHLVHIAYIAGLSEEIAIKATRSSTRAQIRKCVGCLWDANTTLKYLLENYQEETSAEQAILVHRIEDTLRVLGGTRKKVTSTQIEELLRKRLPKAPPKSKNH